MNITPEDAAFYTTQYQETILKNVENKYCAKQRHVPVSKPENELPNDLFPFVMASGSGQSSYDPYDLSSDDEEYLKLNHMPEMAPGQSDHTARFVNTTRLFSHSLSQLPKKWGQINPNLNYYHSYPKKISNTCWIRDITDWWHQQ